MKNSIAHGRVIAALAFVVLIAIPVSAQLKTPGEAVDVVDGKTVVVVVPAGRVNVELPYVEVPEPAQALHASVRDHVKHLVVGKQILLQTTSITRGKVTGKLTVNGVDLGQQLLRDGAAWHVPIAVSGQSKPEFDAYAESEALARLEKRGVWSVAGLEPAWEFRARLKAEEQPAPARARSDSESARADRRKRTGYWSDDNPFLTNPGGLAHGYNAASKTGFLSLMIMGVKEDARRVGSQRTAVDITYFYTEKGKDGRTGFFQVQVMSVADRWRFLKENTLVLEIDGTKVVVGKAKRVATQNSDEHFEKLTYTLTPAAVRKLVNGGEVVLKISEDNFRPQPVVLMLLNNMLQLAN